MWFGTTPDETLVDADFPRRFVPRAFDCILRNGAHELLAAAASLSRVPSDGTISIPPGATVESLALELGQAKSKIRALEKERDKLRAAVEAITAAVAGV